MHKRTLNFVAVRYALAATAFIAGASFCFLGERWHSQPTFFYVNRLPIPWFVYGIWLVLAALCLIWKKTRANGFRMGGIIYSFLAICAWLSVIGGLHLHWLPDLHFPKGSIGSLFAACNITTIAILYWSALHWVVYSEVDPDRFNLRE